MKNPMMLSLSLVVCLSLVLVFVGCQATRGGYESAPYSVVRSEGKFELRDYPQLTVVETTLSGAGKGDDGSFRRLFGFISGANEGGQKVSMTTPVFVSGSDSNRTMAFVMPAKVQAAGVPEPTEDSVSVREFSSGRFAVLRYSGSRSAKHEAEVLDRLNLWMTREGFKPVSPAVYGYFDPPWTPSFLRRNEVMVQIKTGE